MAIAFRGQFYFAAEGHSYFAREGQHRLPSGVKHARLFQKPNCQQNSHNECTYEEEEEGLSLKSRRFGRRNAKKEVKADSSTEGTADAISDAYEGDTDARWNTD